MWWIVGRITVGSFDNNKITFRNRHLQLGGEFFMSKIVNKEMMSKCKVNDCYHRAFFYVMGIAGETSVEKILRLIAIVNLYTSEYLLIN